MTLKKNQITARSFHRRIREGGAHYFDDQQFMGVDPFDRTKFHEDYRSKDLESSDTNKKNPRE